MSHSVHPKIFRIRGLYDWNSRGFQKKPAEALEEDFIIREFLKKRLSKNSIERIEIERFTGKVNIIIFSARPGMIIGRGGGGVEELRKLIEKILAHSRLKGFKAKPAKKEEIRIEIREVKNPWTSAVLAGQWIAQQIERRMPPQKILKQSLEKIMANKEIQGARVEVAGRLGGNEIARTLWLKKGKLPRQTLRADIDYSENQAFCTYGVIGIKVWLYKGEKF